jgi:hypothetical protein
LWRDWHWIKGPEGNRPLAGGDSPPSEQKSLPNSPAPHGLRRIYRAGRLVTTANVGRQQRSNRELVAVNRSDIERCRDLRFRTAKRIEHPKSQHEDESGQIEFRAL